MMVLLVSHCLFTQSLIFFLLNSNINSYFVPQALHPTLTYTITQIFTIKIRMSNMRRRTVQLVKLRSPWGVVKFKGAWSLLSQAVPKREMRRLGLVDEGGGEFVMSFEVRMGVFCCFLDRFWGVNFHEYGGCHSQHFTVDFTGLSPTLHNLDNLSSPPHPIPDHQSQTHTPPLPPHNLRIPLQLVHSSKHSRRIPQPPQHILQQPAVPHYSLGGV